MVSKPRRHNQKKKSGKKKTGRTGWPKRKAGEPKGSRLKDFAMSSWAPAPAHVNVDGIKKNRLPDVGKIAMEAYGLSKKIFPQNYTSPVKEMHFSHITQSTQTGMSSAAAMLDDSLQDNAHFLGSNYEVSGQKTKPNDGRHAIGSSEDFHDESDSLDTLSDSQDDSQIKSKGNK